jgi:DNA polymerase alpha subunit p180 N terminal
MSRRGSTSRGLDALRKARHGEASAVDLLELNEDDGIYDEVDEETYRRLVVSRRRKGNGIVFEDDDDDLGYADTGEELEWEQAEKEGKMKARKCMFSSFFFWRQFFPPKQKTTKQKNKTDTN